MFPIAKSSEVTFVNKTVFDRFAAATGVTLEALTTWEGMLDAAKKYYEWTDGLTPDVTNDGKIFLFYDMPFNYMQLAAKQLGGSFLEGEAINFSDPAAEKAWSLFADAAAAIESTASVIHFKDTVAYADNTTEPLELISLPFPVFEGQEKSVIQRGVGLVALGGDKAKEQAAEFCKWLTEPEKNIEFCLQAGYMPVKKEAYQSLFEGGLEQISDAKFRSLFDAMAVLYRDYEFYTPPTLAEEVWQQFREKYGK